MGEGTSATEHLPNTCNALNCHDQNKWRNLLTTVSATAAENGSVLNTEDVMWADVCVQVRAGTR